MNTPCFASGFWRTRFLAPNSDDAMPVTLYVGNLSYDCRDEDIENLFKPFGKLNSVKVVMDNFSGRSKGFGFVEMEEADDAQASIKALDETEFLGRRVRVNEARAREDRGDRPRGGGRGGRGGYGGDRGDRGGYDRDRGSDRRGGDRYDDRRGDDRRDDRRGDDRRGGYDDRRGGGGGFEDRGRDRSPPRRDERY